MKNAFVTSIVLIILTIQQVFGQVSISSDQSTPDPAAGLEVKSVTGGFLPPRMNQSAMNAIADPADGLIIYCTDCGTGNTGRPMVFHNGSWKILKTGCLVPRRPEAGTHSATASSVTWNWQASAGATEYRWSSSSSFANSFSMGTSTTYTETGLNCNWAYTRYVWAKNDCGRSDSIVLTQTTPVCPWTCNQNITDPRDNKEYMTVQIGTQCWFRQNLNIGTMISGSVQQKNNGVIEKYCYNDLSGNCNTYGGMYRWGEMVQYLNGASDSTTWYPEPTGNVQGICPAGWHLPSEAEWNTLIEYLGGSASAGGAMKESTQDHWAAPNTGATNTSGFTALPGGYRHPNGSFYNYNTDGLFWSVTEMNPPGSYEVNAGRLFLSYLSSSATFSQVAKRYGLYVRCLKDN